MHMMPAYTPLQARPSDRPRTPSNRPASRAGSVSRPGTSHSSHENDQPSSSSSSSLASALPDYVCWSSSQLREGRGTDTRVETLGDCLGKGAFGSVYRALNWGTGQTVAVKQVRLSDLPKSELRVIMVRSPDSDYPCGGGGLMHFVWLVVQCF